MKDDLGLSALVRTAHEYAKRKAACRKEWAVSIASARALNEALDALAVAAEGYARAAAQVFAVDPPAPHGNGGGQESWPVPPHPAVRRVEDSPEPQRQPEMAVYYAWCAVCEGTGIEMDDEEQFPCTNTVRHEP